MSVGSAGAHVLVIDDNPGDIQLIELGFETNEVAVRIDRAGDGVQAQEVLRALHDAGNCPQLILLDEAHVARVMDPAAGTGWSEQVTRALCHAAWAFFQEIEVAGGAAAALERGLIQRKVTEARTTRAQNLADGKETLIGANAFTATVAVPVLDVEKPIVPAMPTVISVEPLAPMRFAAPFENVP